MIITRLLADSFVGSERDEDKGGISDCLACYDPFPKESIPAYLLFQPFWYCPKGHLHVFPSWQ